MERLVSRDNFPILPHIDNFVTKRIPGATVEIKLEGSVGKLVAVKREYNPLHKHLTELMLQAIIPECMECFSRELGTRFT
jgi:hypothetical protein